MLPPGGAEMNSGGSSSLWYGLGAKEGCGVESKFESLCLPNLHKLTPYAYF